MPDPLDADAGSVPSIGRRQLVLVDGRTFAISDENGDMIGGTHGMVHDDLRHLSTFVVSIEDTQLELLAASSPTPLTSVTVARLGGDTGSAVLTRRRWLANGLREDVHLHNSSKVDRRWTLTLRVAGDFAHVFDVKAGVRFADRFPVAECAGCFVIQGPSDLTPGAANGSTSCRIVVDPVPDRVDQESGTLAWSLDVPARSDRVVTITVEPIIDGQPAGLAFPHGSAPGAALPMRRLAAWQASVPQVTSVDPRLALVVDQALADIAALRIVDSGHAERAVVAAGAPWFMTLFGRDSLLTSWMTLPFEPSLAAGVLGTLADLQGTHDDPVAEEQPGKILHELRRRGGGGPFANRQRYYGTVDATPLFVLLAAEARRWGALSDGDLDRLAPSIDAAVGWITRNADTNPFGFVDYIRSDATGLSNQGWKDSWDGISFADGSMPAGPISLAEVQGYTYAALIGAAEMSSSIALSAPAAELTARAVALREQFNERFWDPRGWFVVGLDGRGVPIDSLTTNPGHALLTGIADPELAGAYLDRLMEPAMWTGWGLRTLADTMDAYDPLSYHNGSVWPHDTALCAAGAARYGRWDVVDRIVDGALDAACQFAGRPPELFAGICRDEVPMPVAYPSSCSPQAWASASVLLLVRSMLGLEPDAVTGDLRLTRPSMAGVPDMTIDRLHIAGRRARVSVLDGSGTVRSG